MNGLFGNSNKAPNKDLLAQLGPDELPVESPVLPAGTRVVPLIQHLHRREWHTEGQWLEMHRIAEIFRRILVNDDQWTCRGFNCHDCVEKHATIDQIVSCAIDKNAAIVFDEPDIELAWYMRPYLRRLLGKDEV